MIRRKALDIFSLTSLVIFIAVVTLALRNIWRIDVWVIGDDGDRSIGILSDTGQLRFLLWEVTGYREKNANVGLTFRHTDYGTDPIQRLFFLTEMNDSLAGMPDVMLDEPPICERGSWQVSISGIHHIDENPVLHCSYFGVRCWLAALLFGLLPLVSAVRILNRFRRRKAGQCRSCGYNLTGNLSGTCPECGTLIPTPSSILRELGG